MGNKHRPKVQQVPSTVSQKLKFSFEYYDNSSDKYCLSCWTRDQIRKSLLRIQDICTKTFLELRRDSAQYHFYETEWHKTIKPLGFPNPALKALPSFHFSLLGVNGQKARVFGAYGNDTFYIVWFDLNHEILPVALKHT